MGFRSGDPESDGTGLGEDDSGDLAEFAADFVGQRLARRRVDLASFLTFGHHRLDTGGGCADHPSRTSIEEAAPGLASGFPGPCNSLIVDVGRWPRAGRFHQLEGMPNARQPRHRLGIGQRRFLRLGLGEQVKHDAGLASRG